MPQGAGNGEALLLTALRRLVDVAAIQPVLLRVEWYQEIAQLSVQDCCVYVRRASGVDVVRHIEHKGRWRVVVKVIGCADAFLTTSDVAAAQGCIGVPRRALVFVGAESQVEFTVARGEYGLTRK